MYEITEGEGEWHLKPKELQVYDLTCFLGFKSKA